MLALAGILLALGGVAFVLAPFATHAAAPLNDGPDALAEMRELLSLRDVTYEALRDLEFDFHAGKIGESDYRELKQRFAVEAMEIVQRIDALEARLPGRKERSRSGA